MATFAPNSSSVTITSNFDNTSNTLKQSRGLSEEQLDEMSGLLDNILQDALVTCEEECCAEQADKIDINAISRKIVKMLTEDLLLPKFDVLEYQKQINKLKKELQEAQNKSYNPNHYNPKISSKQQFDEPSHPEVGSWQESATYWKKKK